MAPPEKYNWNDLENDAIYTNNPLNYRDLSKKYKISYHTIKRKASIDKWTQRHEEYVTKMLLVRNERKLKEFNDVYMRIDERMLALSLALLEVIEMNVNAARERQDGMRTSDLKNLVDLYVKFQQSLYQGKGDVLVALHQLMVNGFIPADYLPQILGAVRQNQETLKDQLRRAFSGTSEQGVWENFP